MKFKLSKKQIITLIVSILAILIPCIFSLFNKSTNIENISISTENDSNTTIQTGDGTIITNQ